MFRCFGVTLDTFISEWLTKTLMQFKLGVVIGDDGVTSDDVKYEL